MRKKVTILGATGTIGQNTLELVNANPDKFEVETLISRKNVKKLSEAAKKCGAKNVVIEDESKLAGLKEFLKDTNINTFAGHSEVLNLSSEKVDIYISGAVGSCALKPTLKAIESGNKIGLANKECLVSAGRLMMEKAKEYNSKIVPIDSEHNAIYQIFDFDNINSIEEVILTASGGPFREFSKEELETVTKEMAVKHPNWVMGQKISVDSATMMNKGLEIIEAYYLFGVDKNKIRPVVHKESIIHGIVTYNDGSMLLGMANPDMKVPISYALNHPDRLRTDCKRIYLSEIGNLSFAKPDYEKFRCLQIAKDALYEGQKACISLNSANEIAVGEFLSGGLKFTEIPEIVEMVVEKVISSGKSSVDSLEEVFELEEISEKLAAQLIEQKAK